MLLSSQIELLSVKKSDKVRYMEQHLVKISEDA